MANKKISDLPAATQANLTDALEKSDQGTAPSQKVTVSQILSIGTRLVVLSSFASNINVTTILTTLPMVASYDPTTSFSGSIFTAKVAGAYLITGTLSVTALSSATRLILAVFKNGSILVQGLIFDFTSGGANDVHPSGATIIQLAVNDTLDLRAAVGAGAFTGTSGSFNIVFLPLL